MNSKLNPVYRIPATNLLKNCVVFANFGKNYKFYIIFLNFVDFYCLNLLTGYVFNAKVQISKILKK